MGPKPAAKKGKDDQEDFSDVPTLPPLNSVTFSMQYYVFNSLEIREKVQKYVTEHWPQDRIKTLSREEIITYGKAKLIIVDATTLPPIPQDDPRLKMSSEDQISKAASDRLYELQVHARRAKKEKIIKLEEEAKLQGISEPHASLLDPDQLDVLFQLIDFPKNRAEAIAFAKHNNVVNLIVSINQSAQEVDTERSVFALYEEHNDNNYQIEYNEDLGYYEWEIADETEMNHRQTVRQRLTDFSSARTSAPKSSVLRLSGQINLGYFNHPHIEDIVKENGEVVSERKEREQVFFEVLIHRLEHFGALFIKYLRFREKITLQPLLFDKEAQEQLDEIEEYKGRYAQWGQEVELLASQQQQQEDMSGLDQAQQEYFQSQREAGNNDIEAQKGYWLEGLDERKARVEGLKKRVKMSVDDTRDYSSFSLAVYQKDFISNKETQNQVASIMSSMITQLAKDSKANDSFDQFQDGATQDSSMNDLFSNWNDEAGYKLGISDRPFASNAEEQNTNGEASFLSAPPSRALARQGTRALAKANTAIGEIEYFEEMDQARKVMSQLPKEVTMKEEEKGQDIYLREKNIIKNLLIPGKNRYLMPDIPSKSSRLREAEKPAIYPFSTLPVDDSERAQIMRAFQELVKNNFIDEGVAPEQRQAKYKVYERNYQSHMNDEIMGQVIADALLQDPEIATLYFPRDDKLLVALFNKTLISKPDGAALDVDGQRDWTAANRVMPDFLHWLTSFADQVVITQQITQQMMQKSSDQYTTSLGQPLKYQLDDEMIPSVLLDIDDVCVQDISEKSQFLYPDDNSVMRVDTYQVAGQCIQKAVTIKDNLTFGLRKANPVPEDTRSPENKEYGLVSYRAIGSTEFWIRFENDTKMMVECISYDRNPQRLIRIDPPKPTAEELAAREEALKVAQAAAAKSKGKGQQANAPIIEEYKEPEPTWEAEPFNYLDSLFTEEQIQRSQGTMITTTLPNGLIVRHMPNGDVCQTTEAQMFDSDNPEKDRVIIGKGIVIRHLRNTDAEILFPRGEKAYFQRQSMMWIVTNNKGMRQAKKDGYAWDISAIPCAIEKDAVTEARMMVREDNVVTITYKDGSSYCQHADGTQMKINADQSEIRVEKDGYAPVVIQITSPQPYKQDDEFCAPSERTADGLVTQTLLPDGTIVEGYSDFPEGQDALTYRYFYKRSDYSVVYVDKEGYIVVVSSNSRSAMNEVGGKTKIGQDTDYLREIFSTVRNGTSRLSPCVYYAKLLPNDFTLSTIGASGSNLYTLWGNYSLSKQALVYVEKSGSQLEKSNQQASKLDEIRDLEDVGGPKNPFDKHFNYPRFFVMSPDGGGYELLSKEQLEYYFRIRKNNSNSLKQRKIVMVGSTSAKSHYFVTKVKSLTECEQELQIIKHLDFPQNAQYAIQRVQKQKPKRDEPIHTRPDQYLFRQIFEFQEFEIFKQDAYYDDLGRYKQWKLNQVRYDNEFGIVFVPPKDGQLDYKKIEDDEYLSKRINLKILKERRNKRADFLPEEYKTAFINLMQQNDEVTEYHRRMTQYDRSDSFRVTSAGFNQGDAGLELQTQNNFHKDNFTSNESRRIKKKSQDQARLTKYIHDIHTMINTPTFLANYFKSYDGQMFSKNNPEKPPSQEIIMRMSHRINRSQQNSEKAQSNYDGYSQKSGQSPVKNMGSDDMQKLENEDKDNPIVALEPEDHNKQGSAYMRSKVSQNNEEGTMAPFSLYQQEKQYLKQREQESVLKAEEHHVIKTKDFNVYGRLRQDKPYVKATQKSTAQSDLNEKFITTECIADRRIKISSMAPRQYINAPSVEQVRKQGQHQIIDQAIENKWTFPQVINKVNSMVTSVLHDSLKRSFNVMPAKCVFGKIKAGKTYELVITLKNEDNLSQRIQITAPQDKRITIQQEEQGPIAPGLLRRILVTLRTDEKEAGIIKDSISLKAKTDIYSIPVEAQIMSHDEFEEANRESQAIKGVPVTNSRVKERLTDSIRKSWKASARPNQGNSHDQDDSRYEEDNKGNWIHTTGSESKLPHLPPIDNRPFEIDTKRPLKDLLKKQ